ncbi:MAG: peptidoglycan-binding domain-containing protein [Cyanobacteria bacterium P01_F01_bin.13]
MSKLLTATLGGAILAFVGLPSYAQSQRLPAPPPPPLPNPSSIPFSTTTPSLGPGDFGDDVISLQQALERNGLDPGPIDGDYGPMTQDAVEEFQQWYDLPVTGVAGPQTLDVLGLIDDVGTDVVAVNVPRSAQGSNFPYIAAVIESTNELGQVQRVFGNAAIDSVRQGKFINIGRYGSRSDAAARVREARRLGFDARILYRR